MSCVTYQVSGVMCHMSRVFFFTKLPRYSPLRGLLIAPAEGSGLRLRVFLPFGQKKVFFYAVIAFGGVL